MTGRPDDADGPTRAHRETPTVDHERVRAAMREAGRASAEAWAAEVAARNAAHVAAGGHICGSLTRTGDPCTHPAVRRYLPGWRCRHHTPAALAGRPEVRPDPEATVDGLRRAAGVANPETTPTTPASGTVIDDRAVASGKRRSSSGGWREARDRLANREGPDDHRPA